MNHKYTLETPIKILTMCRRVAYVGTVTEETGASDGIAEWHGREAIET